MKAAVSVLCAVWLVVGMTAAGQRDHFARGLGSCDGTVTIGTTIAAGPLNYNGLNPAVSCPEPSA
jgi:hypothetical protein